MHDMKHMDFLESVSRADIETLRRKETSYKGSWKKRGGIGAFMMLARKWDRLENMLQSSLIQYDIFGPIMSDTSGADGTALAEVRDLRQYLLLVEAEIQSQLAQVKGTGPVSVSTIEPVAEKVYATTHSDSAEFPVSEKHEPCGSYHSSLVDGLCQNCGYPQAMHPVRAIDSNKHAERANEDWRAGRKVDGEWKVKPVINADLHRRLADGDLKNRYVVTGQFAQVNRMLYAPEIRATLFKPLPQTAAKMDFEKLAMADREFYEPRPGVEGEMQLKKEYREGWGA